MARGHGVVATALELIEIEEVARLTAPGDVFTAAERAYAASKTDPERRLAVRLAAKQATLRLLGGGLGFGDVEILPARGGPPSLRLSPQATLRLRALGATRTLVSLTHGRSHAAATVLALEDA